MAADDHGEAEGALSLSEELFARLVHDLRNPLGIIESFAEALPEAPAEERDELLGRLRLNAQRALHVLDELSLLADLRAGRARAAELQSCDVGALIAAVAAAVAALERRSVPVRQRAAPALAPVAPAHLACALRSLLRQVMHTAASGDDVEVSIAVPPGEVTVRIAVTVAPVPRGLTAPPVQLDVELAAAIAALYGGRCEAERRPGGLTVTLTVGTAAGPRRR